MGLLINTSIGCEANGWQQKQYTSNRRQIYLRMHSSMHSYDSPASEVRTNECTEIKVRIFMGRIVCKRIQKHGTANNRIEACLKVISACLRRFFERRSHYRVAWTNYSKLTHGSIRGFGFGEMMGRRYMASMAGRILAYDSTALEVEKGWRKHSSQRRGGRLTREFTIHTVRWAIERSVWGRRQFSSCCHHTTLWQSNGSHIHQGTTNPEYPHTTQYPSVNQKLAIQRRSECCEMRWQLRQRRLKSTHDEHTQQHKHRIIAEFLAGGRLAFAKGSCERRSPAAAINTCTLARGEECSLALAFLTLTNSYIC